MHNAGSQHAVSVYVPDADLPNDWTTILLGGTLTKVHFSVRKFKGRAAGLILRRYSWDPGTQGRYIFLLLEIFQVPRDSP